MLLYDGHHGEKVDHGGNGLFLPGALPAPAGIPVIIVIQVGAIFIDLNHYFGYPAWYGYSTPVYIPFDHRLGRLPFWRPPF